MANKSLIKHKVWAKNPKGGGTGIASVNVDGITVFGDGNGTPLHAAPGYVDINLADAQSDELSNTVVPGWYRIVNWSLDTAIQGYYCGTYENNNGDVRYCPYGFVTLANSIFESAEAIVDITIGGLRSIYSEEQDVRYTVSTAAIATAAIGSINSIWNNANWFRVELTDPAFTSISNGYLTNVKGSIGDSFTFIGDNYIDGLNPGTRRTINFVNSSINITSCDIQNNRIINIFTSHQYSVCTTGVNTFTIEVTDGDLSGSSMFLEESFGVYVVDTSGGFVIDTLSRSIQYDGEIICIRLKHGSSLIDLSIGGNMILEGSATMSLDKDGEHIYFAYNSDVNTWIEISRLNY